MSGSTSVQRGLGDVLVDERLLGREQLGQAQRAAARLGKPLVAVLLEQGLVTEYDLVDALRRGLELELFDPVQTPVEADAVREVPFEEADRLRLLPLQVVQRHSQRILRVAMADPLDAQAIEDIAFSTGSVVEPLIARASQLADAIRANYRGVVTKVIPRELRDQGTGVDAAVAPEQPRRGVFGAGIDPHSLRTRPVERVQKLASSAQKIDALVALLVRRGVITVDDYEEQLEALLGAPGDEKP